MNRFKLLFSFGKIRTALEVVIKAIYYIDRHLVNPEDLEILRRTRTVIELVARLFSIDVSVIYDEVDSLELQSGESYTKNDIDGSLKNVEIELNSIKK